MGSHSLHYFGLTLLTILFIVAGVIGLYITIPIVNDDVSTTCRVLNQTVNKEQCLVSCPDCTDVNDGFGGGCVGGECSYAPYTCYVTWGYNLYGHLYTTQTSICSNVNGDVYLSNYSEACWYNKKNSRDVTFKSPVFAWVILAVAICFVIAGFSVVISMIFHYRKNRNRVENYQPV